LPHPPEPATAVQAPVHRSDSTHSDENQELAPKLRTEKLERAAFGLLLFVVAHGAYLAYNYFKYRSLNTISVALLILVSAVFVFLTLLIVLAKFLNRSEEKKRARPNAA